MNLHELKTLLKEHSPHKLGIIGIPQDANASFMRGTDGAPPLIRKALFSDASNLWTETGINIGADERILDAGDIAFNEADDPMAAIDAALTLLLDHPVLPIALGGDHSITYPIVRAFRRKYGKISVLHFDAHPDLYHEFNDNRDSHACTFARIMEDQLVDRLLQVGIRTMNGHQRKQAEKFGVEVIEMRQWDDNIRFNFESPVYLSFDMDVLDPAYAPGVSHREPGGLSTRQVINALHRIEGSVIGADIVEFNPRNDPSGVTATVGAKLLKEIAGILISHA